MENFTIETPDKEKITDVEQTPHINEKLGERAVLDRFEVFNSHNELMKIPVFSPPSERNL